MKTVYKNLGVLSLIVVVIYVYLRLFYEFVTTKIVLSIGSVWPLVCSILLAFIGLLWFFSQLDLLPKKPYFTAKISVKQFFGMCIKNCFPIFLFCNFVFIIGGLNLMVVSGVYTHFWGTYGTTQSYHVKDMNKRRASKTTNGFTYHVTLDSGKSISLVTSDFYHKISKGDTLIITPQCSMFMCFTGESEIVIEKVAVPSS